MKAIKLIDELDSTVLYALRLNVNNRLLFISQMQIIDTKAEMFKLYLVFSFLSVCHMESSLPQSPELGKKGYLAGEKAVI